MASVLVTGASGGLGLALVQELAARPVSDIGPIIAVTRASSPALDELVGQNASRSSRVTILRLDVADESSAQKAVAQTDQILGAKGLDVLINNAGICQYADSGVKSMSTLQESFTVNVMSVHWMTQAFLPLLRKGNLKKVANVQSIFASIGQARAYHAFPAPAYKISKTAMGALTVQYALDHEAEGFTFIALCPGEVTKMGKTLTATPNWQWLKTAQGGDTADLTAQEGARASLDLVFQPGQHLNGRMVKVLVEGWQDKSYKYDGSSIPW